MSSEAFTPPLESLLRLAVDDLRQQPYCAGKCDALQLVQSDANVRYGYPVYYVHVMYLGSERVLRGDQRLLFLPPPLRCLRPAGAAFASEDDFSAEPLDSSSAAASNAEKLHERESLGDDKQ